MSSRLLALAVLYTSAVADVTTERVPYENGWLVLMKKRFLLLIVPIALISAACAPNAGALEPTIGSNEDTGSGDAATSQASSQDRLSAVQATTQALLPTRTAEPTRTAPAVNPAPLPAVSPGPGSTANAPSPQPTPTRVPTATPVRFDPNATPTPLWSSPPELVPTATSTPVPVGTTYVPPTVVAAPTGNEFQSLLKHQYTLPNGWSEVRTESALVLYDSTRKISIKITEQTIEPWKYPTALALGVQSLPTKPADWDEWSLLSRRPIRSDSVYEFQYNGMKDNHKFVNFIQWFVWGDIHVQVSAEVPESDWNSNSSIRSNLTAVMDSFDPHDGSQVFTEAEAMALLAARMDDRQSGVFARDEVIKARYEMTCRQLFTELIQGAVHFGDGLWQMSAQTLDGTETWRVFEPSGAILALDYNKSTC